MSIQVGAARGGVGGGLTKLGGNHGQNLNGGRQSAYNFIYPHICIDLPLYPGQHFQHQGHHREQETKAS